MKILKDIVYTIFSELELTNPGLFKNYYVAEPSYSDLNMNIISAMKGDEKIITIIDTRDNYFYIRKFDSIIDYELQQGGDKYSSYENNYFYTVNLRLVFVFSNLRSDSLESYIINTLMKITNITIVKSSTNKSLIAAEELGKNTNIHASKISLVSIDFAYTDLLTISDSDCLIKLCDNCTDQDEVSDNLIKNI